MKFVLLCSVTLLIASPSLKNAVGQEAKHSQSRITTGQAALQSTWRAINSTSNGEAASKEMLAKITLVFAGDTVSIMGAPSTHFKVDDTLTPAHIDFLNSRHQVSIYKLTGETLALCVGQDGERPTSFVTKPYTDHTYILLQRSTSAPNKPEPIAASTPSPPSLSAGFVKGPWSLPIDGFTLSLPAGWQGKKGGANHRVLSCLLPGKPGNPRQIILVHMGVSEAPTLRGHAASLTSPNQVRFLGGSRQLDKKAVLVVQLMDKDQGLTKHRAQQRDIVTRQGKQTFTINVLADADQKIDATIKAVFQGWKWQPFADPTDYLQLNATPTTLSQGLFQMQIPDIMQPVLVEPDVTMLGIKDARSGVVAFTTSVAVINAAQPIVLEQMRRNFTENLKQRLDSKTEVQWQNAVGEPARTLSSFFPIPAEMEESGYPAVSAYGLVKLPGNQWGVLTFTITGQEVKSKGLYIAAAQKIFASVRLGAIKHS